MFKNPISLKSFAVFFLLLGRVLGAGCDVTNTDDDVGIVGSLRWAVEAHQDGDCDEIVVDPDLGGPISIGGTRLDFTSPPGRAFRFNGNGITITRSPSFTFPTILKVVTRGSITIRNANFDLGDPSTPTTYATTPTRGVVEVSSSYATVILDQVKFENGKNSGLLANRCDNVVVTSCQFNENNSAGGYIFGKDRNLIVNISNSSSNCNPADGIQLLQKGTGNLVANVTNCGFHDNGHTVYGTALNGGDGIEI